jgi:hypothetical protein
MHRNRPLDQFPILRQKGIKNKQKNFKKKAKKQKKAFVKITSLFSILVTKSKITD